MNTININNQKIKFNLNLLMYIVSDGRVEQYDVFINECCFLL